MKGEFLISSPKQKPSNKSPLSILKSYHSKDTMISSKKLLHLARKWRMAAETGRKRISFRRTSSKKISGDLDKAPIIKKGHFAIYTSDGGRFEVPLSYLASGVIRELFDAAEEEFGIPGEGPIILPIDTSSMEYMMSLIRRGLGSEQEAALLASFTRCSKSYFKTDEARFCPQVTCI
ncbi:hypothetical protein MLD38_013626 [Melastoma candidum]|uniref:Uncharacterized protein n=1 Tax=Melastoma candidum TaxID=119954 RepID=A0ACB9RAT0_9MYRT|nr:hypothetical protein MLD38_013626 [Melastoma candidum]